MQKTIILLSVMIFLVSLIGTYWGHENAHVQINKYYGVDSHIEIGLFPPEIKTVAEQKVPEEAQAVHGINEAIGYQLAPLFFGIMGLIMIVVFAVYRKPEEER